MILAAAALGTAAWFARERRRPVGAAPPGRLALFIAELGKPGEATETNKLTAALRETIGRRDSLLWGRVETRALSQPLDLETLAGGGADELARRLNASVILGRLEAPSSAKKPAFVVVLRLPPSTDKAHRPDLERLSARLIYPARTQGPEEPGREWKPAAALAQAHLLLAAGLGPGVVSAFNALGKSPDQQPEWADFNEACGSVALAAAVAANAGPDTLDLAVSYLSAAWRAREKSPGEAAAATAGVNLASALLLRLRSTSGGSDADRARETLESICKPAGSHPDSDVQTLGRYLLATVYAGASPTLQYPDPSNRALELLDQVQALWTQAARPYAWASAQLVRTQALAAGSGPDLAASCDQAIAAAEAALRILTRDPFPSEWASAQSQLGGLYATRPAGGREDNLRRAWERYSNALVVWSPRTAKEPWARDLASRAMVLIQLPGGAPEENLRAAISDAQRALEAVSRSEQPRLWARIHDFLGVAVKRLGGGQDPARIREAMAHFQSALEVYVPENYPLECAKTLSNLAGAYADLPGPDRKHALEMALQSYDAALGALEFGLDRRIGPQIRQNRARAQQELNLLTGGAAAPDSSPSRRQSDPMEHAER